MKKLIKKIGKALVIIFTKDEQKIYGIREGKVFNIEMNEEKKR